MDRSFAELVKIPAILNGVKIGRITQIGYETIRDGERGEYLHRFATHARPDFVVSENGKQLGILNGLYNFTDRGIVDHKKGR